MNIIFSKGCLRFPVGFGKQPPLRDVGKLWICLGFSWFFFASLVEMVGILGRRVVHCEELEILWRWLGVDIVDRFCRENC